MKKKFSLFLILIALLFMLTGCLSYETKKEQVVFVNAYDNYSNLYIDFKDVTYDIPSDYNITYPSSICETITKDGVKYEIKYWSLYGDATVGRLTKDDFPLKVTKDNKQNYRNQLTFTDYYDSIIFISTWGIVEE